MKCWSQSSPKHTLHSTMSPERHRPLGCGPQTGLQVNTRPDHWGLSDVYGWSVLSLWMHGCQPSVSALVSFSLHLCCTSRYTATWEPRPPCKHLTQPLPRWAEQEWTHAPKPTQIISFLMSEEGQVSKYIFKVKTAENCVFVGDGNRTYWWHLEDKHLLCKLVEEKKFEKKKKNPTFVSVKDAHVSKCIMHKCTLYYAWNY